MTRSVRWGLNEPFGLYAFGLVWKEPGSNYKR